ncbi:MAG: replication-relaxation family protein [Hyphomicrobiaceae bacterium]
MTTAATMGLEKSRRTRYRRDTPTPMRLTEDDIAIIRHVARHRFLRSTHLLRLMANRSAKKMVERLGQLYHNQYLDRPRAQLDYYSTAGSAPMVYALGNRGADVLAEMDGLDRGQVDWTWKNRSTRRTFIEHTLLTADTMVAAECASIARPDVILIGAESIIANAPDMTRRSRNPFRLATRAHVNGQMIDLALVPDAVFGLDFTIERRRKYFFLEADRATMPIKRANLSQTSIYRKFLAYVAGGGSTNAFGQHLGLGNFRVLMVTTSPERRDTMIAALKDATGGKGSRQFLFTDRDELRQCADLLDLPWISGKGDIVRLGD